jgi:hypothetical protein
MNTRTREQQNKAGKHPATLQQRNNQQPTSITPAG